MSIFGATMTTSGGAGTTLHNTTLPLSRCARQTGFSHRVGAPTPPRVRGSGSSRFALRRVWGSVGSELPLPLLRGIQAHTFCEGIIHLEYKEITHFGYVLGSFSVLQSDQSSSRASSETSPSQSSPAFLLPLAAVLGSVDRPDATFHAFVNFSSTEQGGVLARERDEATGRR
jgi:hypothetical protein